MAQEQAPQYAYEFEEWDPIKQREVFTRIGLSDQTSERFFRLLCREAADKKSDLVNLNDLLERSLRWAAHPEHHRLQPRFPRAKSVLQNRLVTFVQILAASGLCEIEDEGTMLRLHPLDRVSELAAQVRLTDAIASIRTVLVPASSDVTLPFPSESVLGREAQRLPRRKISYKEFNQSLILDPGEPGDTLLEVSFPSGQQVIVFSRSLVLELKRAAVARMMGYIYKLVNHLTEDVSNAALNRVNYMLRDAFPSVDPAHLYTLERLHSVASGDGGRINGQFDVWSAICRKLIDELDRGRDESEEAIALRQSLVLLYSWYSYARDMEIKVKAGEVLLLDIRNHLVTFPRCITKDELLQREQVKEYIARYGVEEYEKLFTRFIKENDVRAPNAVPGDCVIYLEPENVGSAFIHTGKAAEFMDRRLDAAKDKRLGLVAQEYLLPWQALLRKDRYDERAAAVLGNEKKFHKDIEAVFAHRFPYLYELLNFTAAVPDLLIHICERAGIPLTRFLTVEGKMKSVAVLLRTDRRSVLKKLNKTLSFWQRFAMNVLRFFRFSKSEQRSLWPLVQAQLHATSISQEKKSKPEKRITSLSSEDKAKQEQAKEPVRDMRKLPALDKNRSSDGKKSDKESKTKKKAVDKGVKITRKNGKALAAAFSGGHDKDWFVTRWGASEGITKGKGKTFVDRILNERIGFALESVTVENLEEIAGHIAFDPRLAAFSNKEMMTKYVILSIIEKLK